jgi:hypothetical protein
VIAFQQDLPASAGAHHSMAKVLKPGIGIASTKKKKDHSAEDEGVDQAVDRAMSVSRFLARSRRDNPAPYGAAWGAA